MDKHFKQLLNEYKHLLRISAKIQNWFVETNRNYMKLEEQNYYLKWKNEYLEKWIKKNNPDAKLFKEDSSEFDELSNESENNKEQSDE